ncbi:MAG: cupredoxin domain-containing protein [Phycisphaerales bacterium]
MGGCWVGALALLGVCGSAAGQQTVDVFLFDFEMSIHPPASGLLEDPVIFQGDTIRWVWVDEFHNVVACVGLDDFWESPIFGPGDTFVYTFDIVGEFQYYCAPHGADNGDGTATGMAGVITVLPIPGPGAAALFVAGGLVAARRRR